MSYLKTLAEATEAISNREPFTTGTLAGHWHDLLGGNETYIVTSYGVEIANSNNGKRAVLESAYNYSKTTSKHANIVKRAWGLI